MIEAIQNFDYIILDAIQQSLRCEFLDSFTVILSYVTTSGIIWVAAGITMLLFRKMRTSGIIVLAALTVAFFTGDVLIKHLVNRSRPFSVNSDIILLVKAPSGASFPSTHSCLAAAATTVFLKKNRVFGFIAAILTACIAFSRLYLYVHYPTDIFAGLLLGVLCALITLSFAKGIAKKDRYFLRHRRRK